MSTPTQSYLKVPYDLRPAKQVERRMLIDAFHRLASAGFPITDYQYTGFGSIYFVDFILFHKLLGINKLLSVEFDLRIEKRVRFNAPFRGINIEMSPIGDVIPTLAKDDKHILWLDFDNIIEREHLSAVAQAASDLSPGSILLVTVDVEHPPGAGPADWRRHFESQVGDYLGEKNRNSDFSRAELPALNGHIIEQAVKQGLVGRSNVAFEPLFNFVYKDGHEMLTVGGMFVTPAERRRVRGSSLDETLYYRPTLSGEPYKIRVPKLTRKERLYLDRAMPCVDGWRPEDFELSEEDVSDYREIYRFCPAYAELLL
jgi:hypothetical protein